MLAALGVIVAAVAFAVLQRPGGPAISAPTSTGVLSTAAAGTLPDARKSAVDPVGRETSIVATATVPSVAVYRDTTDAQPIAQLTHPISSGGPLVFLVDERAGEWLRVLLPMRPNGSQGWIRAGDVSLAQHRFRIDVYLAEFRLDVFNSGKLIYAASIGVARDNAPTPGGRYYTTELLQPPTPDSAYGALAYGLSGFSDVFASFNGGPGQLGIHGTNDPSTIGTKVSAGCVRLRNDDILAIGKLLPLGVPVNIIP